jgi:hypothetical protein
MESRNFANAESQAIINDFPFKDHLEKVTFGQLQRLDGQAA